MDAARSYTLQYAPISGGKIDTARSYTLQYAPTTGGEMDAAWSYTLQYAPTTGGEMDAAWSYTLHYVPTSGGKKGRDLTLYLTSYNGIHIRALYFNPHSVCAGNIRQIPILSDEAKF